MMTVKQVSTRTGISVRTLQFYDEIGLLRPTEVTNAGYRLYDDRALEKLQQILFFKELDFSLKEIKAILEDPRFDQAAAFAKQRQLIQLKRDRLDKLLGLLDRLIQGEHDMEFKEFDLSEYFRVLNDFKATHTNAIIDQLGSVEQFDNMLAEMRTHEADIAAMAVQQYGSIENFTHAMAHNFEDFLSHGPAVPKAEVNEILQKTEELTRALTADLKLDPASDAVQEAVAKLVAFVDASNQGVEMGENYWSVMAENYLTNDIYITVNDRKYGEGASAFIGRALQAYLKR